MNRLLTTALIFSFGTALTVSPSLAQQSTTSPDKNPNGTAMSDKSSTMAKSEKSSAGMMSDATFVKKAAEGGLAEVELGKLAAEKASNEDVKKFGQKMVDDHSKANDQLKDVAAKDNIELPTEPSAKDKAEKARLEKLSGEQFDRAYMTAMLKDHKKDVMEFRHESKSAKNPDVKSFAEQTLPTLEQHLKVAEQIAPKVGAKMSTTAQR